MVRAEGGVAYGFCGSNRGIRRYRTPVLRLRLAPCVTRFPRLPRLSSACWQGSAEKFIPSLAGQRRAYLVKQLADFLSRMRGPVKDRERMNNDGTVNN